MDEVKKTSLAVVKECEQLGITYYEVPFAPRPVGGEYDDEDDLKILIPKMKLLNSTSGELKKDTRVEGCEEGSFFNVMTREVFEDGLDIVPLFKFTERYYNVPRNSANQVCTSRDGRGKVGLCFSGEYKTHNIPTKFISEDGVDMEVGVCKACPHSKRAYGQQSGCQHVQHLVCVHRSFLNDELTAKLTAGDKTVATSILQNMFTLPFKATGLKALDIIIQAAYVSECYFNQSWEVTSFTDSNADHEWQNYLVTPNPVLTIIEKSAAYSLMLFGQNLRKVITITDIEQPTKVASELNEVESTAKLKDVEDNLA